MIFSSDYKGVPSVTLKTEKYTAIFIPKQGGKMASFKMNGNGKEFLVQNSSPDFIKMGIDDPFEKCECAGFDDMFPTIDPESVNGKFYPDHGEICRLYFGYEITDDKLVMTARSPLGYSYKKTAYCGENGEIVIEYCITNESGYDMPYVWAAHCLVNTEQGGKIILPFDYGEDVDVISESKKVFSINGERIKFCEKLALSDFDFLFKDSRKYYFPNKTKKGYIGYEYKNGVRFMINFDKDKLPYIGVWQDNGGLNGYYCLGLEPCNLPYDKVSAANARGYFDKIKANSSLEFKISLYTE